MCKFVNHHVLDIPNVPYAPNIGIPKYGLILFSDFPKSPINKYSVINWYMQQIDTSHLDYVLSQSQFWKYHLIFQLSAPNSNTRAVASTY